MVDDGGGGRLAQMQLHFTTTFSCCSKASLQDKAVKSWQAALMLIEHLSFASRIDEDEKMCSFSQLFLIYKNYSTAKIH